MILALGREETRSGTNENQRTDEKLKECENGTEN